MKRYYYQVYPVNYSLLHEDEQISIIEGFKELLNQVRRDLIITCRREVKEIRWEDRVFEADLYSFYIESLERIDELLEASGMLYQPLLNPPPSLLDPGRALVKPRYIIHDGRIYRVLSAYRLPATLTEGFLQEILPLVDEARILVKPLHRHYAVRMLQRRYRFLRALMASYQYEGRPPDLHIEEEYSMLEELLQSLVRRETSLFGLRFILVVSGDSREEAKSRAEYVRRELESMGFEVDSPALLQWLMYELGEPSMIYTDTHTLGAFFPFISNTLMETDGVFLGLSRIDKSPVFYDIYIHTNYNLVALGIPGAGKSVTGKALIYRYYRRYGEDLDFYVIDPENEYRPLLQQSGGQVIEVKPGEPLGLDPLKLLPKSDAVDVVSTLANIPGHLYGELASLVKKHESIWSLYGEASDELRKYLKGLLEGPESFVFQGEPVELSNRVGILLRGVESEKLKNIISLLVFARIWRNIEEVPRSRRKIVVVDEAWLLLKNPNAAKWMEAISRRGRKRNVAFIFLTQQPQDVLRNPVGSLIVRNAASKLLLMQDINAIDAVSKEFKLSEAEKQELLRAQPGEGILITENTRLSLRITLSKKEYRLFTTRPTEVEEAA